MTEVLASLTGDDNYFEDFVVGEVVEHARAKTITEVDSVFLTNLVLNTAQAHFNEASMEDTEFGRRITFGGVTAALVIGLASQDASDNATAELGADGIRFAAPVFLGDTVSSFTEVLAVDDRGEGDAGEVEFAHWGVNQRDEIVFEGRRRVLVRKRPGPAR